MFALSVLPRAVTRFQAKFPNVDVTIIQAQMRQTLDGVRTGEIDCTFHSVPADLEPNLAHRVLLRGARPVIVTRNDNPLAAKRRISLEELAAQPWMLPRNSDFFRARMEQVFTRAGIKPPIPVIEFSSIIGSARFLIERRDLLSAYYESFVDAAIGNERLARLHVPALSWTASSSVIYRRDSPLSPAAAKFVETVRAVCAERTRR
jgi:DNA-binding transcriptional LysR family regulator